MVLEQNHVSVGSHMSQDARFQYANRLKGFSCNNKKQAVVVLSTFIQCNNAALLSGISDNDESVMLTRR
jgi:hypothetical protein